jgi:hypothetical protein
MSGILAAAAVARVADAENAEGKNTIFELENDLCSQSSECRDHNAMAKVWASLKRSPRSGVLNSLLVMSVLRLDDEASGALYNKPYRLVAVSSV